MGTLRVQHPFRLAALLLAALGSTVLWYRSRDVAETPRVTPADLGYYVRDARLTATGTDGRVLYRVRAASARRDVTGGTVTLEDIAVSYEPPATAPWELTADHGRVPAGGNIIVLTGEVVARTPATAPPTVIRTDYLEFDPEAQVARTAREVIVERANDSLRARGLAVFLREDRLELRSSIRGTFRP